MLIALLRHGEVAGENRFRGHTDDPLTAAGFSQMYTAIADGGRWDRLISSPSIRCAAFAREYARRRLIPLALDTRLMEIHFGAWEGRTAAELMQTDADALTRFWNDPLHNTPPGGEPLAEFQARVLDAWNDLVVGHAGRRVLVVTHGGVIRVVLCHVLKQPLERLQTFEVRYNDFYCVRVDDAGRAAIDDALGSV